MLKVALHTYIPQRYSRLATFEQSEVSRFILDFKDGRNYATRWAAEEISLALSLCNLEDVVLVCIPAASQYSNTRRYKRFSNLVCKSTGAQNGFSHIHVIGQRAKLHLDRNADIIDNVVLDENYFNGKRVVVIDDICTTCKTANAFIAKLQSAGANVCMALFLAQTKYFGRC